MQKEVYLDLGGRKMKIVYKPVPRKDLPVEGLVLEEYKMVAEESRFVMTRYMQAVVIHIALMGFVAKEIIAEKTTAIALTIALSVFILNFGGYYCAGRFRSMAFHALNRETVLADHLGFQQPHAMVWGYYIGLVWITLSEISLLILMCLKCY